MSTHSPISSRAIHSRGSALTSALLASLALWVSGCMLNPVDGQVVNGSTDSISFGGYTHVASQRVELQFGRGETWTRVTDTTTTAERSLVSDDGVDLFGWVIPTTLPPSAWTNGVTGRFAKVRMLVPGGGAAGRDTFMTTFLSNWSSCHSENPGVSSFISRCASPRSPVAYVFTRDYPTGVDLEITALRRTSSGRTEVRVRNGGRTGTVGRVSCSRFGSSSTLTVNEEIRPGETKSYFNAVAPAGSVACTVSGTNEDGSPEANTSNNSRTTTL